MAFIDLKSMAAALAAPAIGPKGALASESTVIVTFSGGFVTSLPVRGNGVYFSRSPDSRRLFDLFEI